MQRIILFLFMVALTLPGAAQKLRVACMGDSLTEGDGDESGLGYPGRLGSAYKVLNLGKSGWTSEMMVQGYEGRPSQLVQALAFKPQVALIWVGSNDLWYLYEYNNPDDQAEKADLSNYQARLEKTVQSLQKQGTRVILALLDDQSRRPVALQGKAFTGISRAELGRMRAQTERYNQVLRQLSRRYSLTLVDFSQGDLFRNPATLGQDGNHPNARGYDLIARLWKAALESKPNK